MYEFQKYGVFNTPILIKLTTETYQNWACSKTQVLKAVMPVARKLYA